jgi:hypothetical protein
VTVCCVDGCRVLCVCVCVGMHLELMCLAVHSVVAGVFQNVTQVAMDDCCELMLATDSNQHWA